MTISVAPLYELLNGLDVVFGCGRRIDALTDLIQEVGMVGS